MIFRPKFSVGLVSIALGWMILNQLDKKRRSFKGHVVVITGGSRGLGLVTARGFAEEGAHLVLVARDSEELEVAKQDLQSRGAKVITIAADVCDAETAELVIQRTLSVFGKIDVLINNAGIISVGPLENMLQVDFENALATHFWGPFQMMNAAIPHLKKSKGSIVNISSIGGKIPIPHLATYCASKFALGGLSETFRVELAKDGVSVTTVYPGLLRTGSHVNALFKGQRSKEYAWFALGSATPLTSISAKRAARQMIEACRNRQAQLVISIQAKALVLAHALFPNLSAKVLSLVNQSLPDPVTERQWDAMPGWKCKGAFPPDSVMLLADKASVENHELL